tara:strand:+ start:2587 stop:3459 length:873 start_codon:yes stop_codon:yes gene_type:complete
MEKILVTGGAGFIGSNLIQSLINIENIRIVSLDNYYTGKVENHHKSNKVKYVKGSTWDIDKIFKKNDFDVIYHFGEYSRIVYSFDDIEFVSKSIGHGTAKVLNFAISNNSKFIYSASSSKFGNNEKDKNLSPYAFLKAMNVDLIKNYSNWFNLNYEIVYFFNVYGKNHIKAGKYATVIAIFEEQYKKDLPLTVVSPGTQSRDFTHIDDIISGLLLISNNNLNHEWHLRSGTNVPILELVKYFDCNHMIIPERRGERFTSEEFYSDTNKLIGWNAKISLKDYVSEFKESLK